MAAVQEQSLQQVVEAGNKQVNERRDCQPESPVSVLVDIARAFDDLDHWNHQRRVQDQVMSLLPQGMDIDTRRGIEVKTNGSVFALTLGVSVDERVGRWPLVAAAKRDPGWQLIKRLRTRYPQSENFQKMALDEHADVGAQVRRFLYSEGTFSGQEIADKRTGNNWVYYTLVNNFLPDSFEVVYSGNRRVGC